MIQWTVSRLLRVFAPIGLALSLLSLLSPSAFASPHAVDTPSTLASPRIAAHVSVAQSGLIGPKKYYLALGDSLAFGLQPNLDNSDGYADDFYADLKSHGTQKYVNMGCSGETTASMLNGLCLAGILRKYPYIGSQLQAAVNFLHAHAGQVSPVTLDLGVNDITPYFNYSNCTIDADGVHKQVVTTDHNLADIILPALVNAMTIEGKMTGDLFVLNYYNPFVNKCPNTISFARELNQHIAADASGYATKVVDIYAAFGGDASPNPNICTYTWICSKYPYLLG